VGSKAVEAIVKERSQAGLFKSLDDFFERVSTREVSNGCAETLIRAGAFDFLGARRSQLLAVLPRAIQGGQSKQDDRRRGQRGLFDDLEKIDGTGSNGHGNGQGQGHNLAAHNLPEVPELADAELLGGEKKALGFYMSSHPLTRHAGVLQTLATHRAIDLPTLPDKTDVILGGMITSVQVRNVQKSRSGLTRMAKLTFEDLTGSTPAMLWPEEYAKLGELVKNDLIGFVKGTLDRRREPAELIISKILPIETAAAELARGVVVRLHKGIHQSADLERLLRFVRVRPGHLELFLEIVGIEHVRRAVYKAGASLRIRYNEQLTAELEDMVGSGNVRLLGQRGATTRVEPIAQTPVPSQPSTSFATESEIDDSAFDEIGEDLR
jgi:DNA polymerase-3 subunit alpha